MQYYFILGKNQILSKAEIEAVLNLKKIKYQIIEFFAQALVIDSDKQLNIDWLNQRLGGTVKIGLILDKINSLNNIENEFCNLIKCEQGKLHFGFSLYPMADKINITKIQQKLKPVAMEIKRRLREEKKLNSRWVVSKEPELSSVIVKKNQLLKYGTELCFFIKDKTILVGQTLAVQPFEEFGARDYNRPVRDDISGMLPPKLAKIMLNLAQIKDENSIILDPFCGSGTILQEALLMGYENLIGFDKSDKAIKDTEKNLNWLAQNFDVYIKNIKLKKIEVAELISECNKKSIDYIITEPYLGPALKGHENFNTIEKIKIELEDLYTQAFEQFNIVLNRNGIIVIVFPVFKIKNQLLKLDISSNISQLSFNEIIKPELIYSRQKQFIWREIKIFRKS